MFFEVGQYFVTKDIGSLRQFRSVACREYTLPRDDPASQAKGWIQGNMRIGPVLEVTTSFQHFKYGIEIRIWSVNQDNSQSWVRISYGTIKYVVDSMQDSTDIPADPQEERVPQTSMKVVAARSKAKAKPQPRVFVGTTATIPIHERRCIDIEPSEQNLASYDLSKEVINILRHNQTLQREDDGLIPGGQDLSRRQTMFFLPVDPRDESHKDPEHIDFLCTTSSARRAQCMEEAPRRGILG